MERDWPPRAADRAQRDPEGDAITVGSCGWRDRRRKTTATPTATTRKTTNPPINPYPSLGGSPSTVAPPPPVELFVPFGLEAWKTTWTTAEWPSTVAVPGLGVPNPVTGPTEYA